MTEIQALLTLPLETLIVLAAGYIGYRLAYVGKDGMHKPLDALFLSAVFGVFAKLALQVPIPHGGAAVRAAVAFAASLAAAMIWRKWLEHWIFQMLRAARISNSDRHLSAWDSVRMKPGFEPTQLGLRLTDGRRIMCDDLSRFGTFEAGPCILGSDGSIALFVTHSSPCGSDDWTERQIHDDGYGTELTFIPANQIAEIKVFLRR